ncbi:MAG: hypothetical protein ACRETE_09735 [Stenotrophobium sp.]
MRTVAQFDLAITAPLALPWLNDYVVAWLFSWFGLAGSPGAFLPMPMFVSLFCCLAGILGVLWNGCRVLRPDDTLLMRADLFGRLAVAAALAYFLLLRGAPSALWLFVASELAGAAIERMVLKRRRAA